MTDPIADLHVHTTASDGTLPLEEVPAKAAAAGLAAVAITDHDRIHPALDAPIVTRDGITVIRGIELKVQAADGYRFELLGYAVERTEALEAIVDRVQAARIERAQATVERVEIELGIDLDVRIGPGVGRPHIARAIDRHPATDLDTTGAFATLLGTGKPAYVKRWVPQLERGVAALESAASLVAVAHPFRVDDVDGAFTLARRVGGIERWYPYRSPVDMDRLTAFIEDTDVLATGGSDAHGHSLGQCGMPPAAWRQVADRLGID